MLQLDRVVKAIMIDENELQELVESELELYEEVLESHGLLEHLDIFKFIHQDAYNLLNQFILNEKFPEMLLSDLFVHGTLARAQNLSRGVMLGIKDGNRYLLPQCQRALLETCALVNYVHKILII